MDPDAIAQLNDAIRGLTDTLGQSGNALNRHNAAMGASTAGATGNAAALNRATVQSTALTNAQRYQENEAKEAAASSKRLTDAFGHAKDALKSFANAILDVTPGTAKYAGAITSAANAAGDMAGQLGPIGKVAGAVVKGLGELASMALKVHDNVVASFDEMATVGGAAKLSAEGILKLGEASGFSALNIGVFTKHAAAASKELVSMSGSVSGGIAAYSQFTAIGDQQLKKYRVLGMTQDDVIEAQNTYIRQQAEAGQSLKKSPEQLQKASLAYIDNLNVLADLTGVSIKDQQKAQDIAFANENFNAYLFSLDQKEAQLKEQAAAAAAAGNNELAKSLTAQAEETAARKKSKEEYGALAVATMSAANSAGVLEAISTDGAAQWTESNAHVLRLMGDDVNKHTEIMNKGNNASLDLIVAQKDAATRIETDFGEGVSGFGKSSKELSANLGYDNELRKTAARNANTTLEELRKKEADRKAALDAKGDTAIDDTKEKDIMSKQAEQEAYERAARLKMADGLLAMSDIITTMVNKSLELFTTALDVGTKLFTENIDKIVLAGKILAGVLGATALVGAVAKIVAVFRTAAGVIGGILGKFGSIGKAAGKGIASVAGKTSRAFSTVMGPPDLARTKIAGKLLGKLGGRLAGAAGAGLDVMDRVKKKESAGKIAAGVGGGLAGAEAGALGGAALGTLLLPGIGTAIGGILGGAGGYLAGGKIGDTAYDVLNKKNATEETVKGTVAAKKANEETTKGTEATKKATAANEAAAKATATLKKGEADRAKAQAENLKKVGHAMDASADAAKKQADSTKTASDSITSFKDSVKAMLEPLMNIASFGKGVVDKVSENFTGAALNTTADMKKYLATIGLLESAGNPNAKAGTSSAAGLFQFTKGAWKDAVKAMGANFTEQDRFDPVKATQVASYSATQQKARLEKKTGRPVTNTDLYMSHFLGEGGVAKFLRALADDPDAAADSVVGTKAANANKTIFYDKAGKPRSLHEVYGLMNQKVGTASKAVETGKFGGKALPPAIAALAGPQSGSSPSTAPSTPADVTTKIAKAPEAAVAAASTEVASTASTASTSATQTASLNFDTMNMLSQKLDTMISLLESSNSTQDKLLRYSQV